jgi:hypothetical protein
MKQREVLLPQLPGYDDTDSMNQPMWDSISMLDYARKCVKIDRKLANAEAVCGTGAEAVKIRIAPKKH